MKKLCHPFANTFPHAIARTFSSILLGVSALLLNACSDGGSNDHSAEENTPHLSVTDLTVGHYIVSTGDPDQPVIGRYYAAANGERWLMLENADETAKTVYRRVDSQSHWEAIPPVTSDTRITLLRSDPTPGVSPNLNTLAGHYIVQIAPGTISRFSITTDGSLTPGPTPCKLSGHITTGTLPDTARLQLTSSGCGTFPTTGNGILIIDQDLTPASFRLAGDNGSSIFDLWAFRE